MTIKKIDFHQRNVVNLMAEIIMKLNEIARYVNRQEGRLNALQKGKIGEVQKLG